MAVLHGEPVSHAHTAKHPRPPASPALLVMQSGDARDVLRHLPTASVHGIVTSPPYWGLRDYGLPPLVWGGTPGCPHAWAAWRTPAANGLVNKAMGGATLSSNSATRQPRSFEDCTRCGAWRGQLGLEPSPELYVAHLADICRELRLCSGTMGRSG